MMETLITSGERDRLRNDINAGFSALLGSYFSEYAPAYGAEVSQHVANLPSYTLELDWGEMPSSHKGWRRYFDLNPSYGYVFPSSHQNPFDYSLTFGIEGRTKKASPAVTDALNEMMEAFPAYAARRISPELGISITCIPRRTIFGKKRGHPKLNFDSPCNAELAQALQSLVSAETYEWMRRAYDVSLNKQSGQLGGYARVIAPAVVLPATEMVPQIAPSAIEYALGDVLLNMITICLADGSPARLEEANCYVTRMLETAVTPDAGQLVASVIEQCEGRMRRRGITDEQIDRNVTRFLTDHYGKEPDIEASPVRSIGGGRTA